MELISEGIIPQPQPPPFSVDKRGLKGEGFVPILHDRGCGRKEVIIEQPKCHKENSMEDESIRLIESIGEAAKHEPEGDKSEKTRDREFREKNSGEDKSRNSGN